MLQWPSMPINAWRKFGIQIFITLLIFSIKKINFSAAENRRSSRYPIQGFEQIDCRIFDFTPAGGGRQ